MFNKIRNTLKFYFKGGPVLSSSAVDYLHKIQTSNTDISFYSWKKEGTLQYVALAFNKEESEFFMYSYKYPSLTPCLGESVDIYSFMSKE